MLFIFDYDDKNILHLIKRIRQIYSKEIKTLILNQSSERIQVKYSGKYFAISQDDSTITNEDFANINIFFIFRWRMKDTPMVVSALKEHCQRKFSEREWNTFLTGILLYYEQIFPDKIWINRPSIDYILKNKFFLMLMAKKINFLLPRSYISNIIMVNKELDNANEILGKAISSDEQIDKETFYRPSKVSQNYLRENFGEKTDCPSFFQQYIVPEYEVRVYYLLGNILSLKIFSKIQYTDIRDVSKQHLSIEFFSIPSIISSKIIRYCKFLNISYCSFDFIYRNGSYYLIDITPNGSWRFYDTNDIITDWMANILINHEY
jgi:hypothetical protein